MFRILFFFLSFSVLAQSDKIYEKNMGDNNILSSEGWLLDGLKFDYWYTYHRNSNIASEGHYKAGLQEKYWYFYQPNGKLQKQGHYKQGMMSDWWEFYNDKGVVYCKIQYEKDKKQGYCIQYEDDEVVKIEKYNSDIKVGEWDDLKSFELENSLKDLIN